MRNIKLFKATKMDIDYNRINHLYLKLCINKNNINIIQKIKNLIMLKFNNCWILLLYIEITHILKHNFNNLIKLVTLLLNFVTTLHICGTQNRIQSLDYEYN